MNGWEETEHGSQVETLQKKTESDLEDPTAISRSGVFWLHAKRNKGWSPMGSVQNRVVQKKLTTTREADEKRSNERKIFGGEDHCLELLRKVMPKNASRGTANSQRKMQVATPCTDDHQIPPEGYEATGEHSAGCAQIVTKFLSLAKIGRPDLGCSVK